MDVDLYSMKAYPSSRDVAWKPKLWVYSLLGKYKSLPEYCQQRGVVRSHTRRLPCACVMQRYTAGKLTMQNRPGHC